MLGIANFNIILKLCSYFVKLFHFRLNNNVVSGFFTVSLVRTSDGALLMNATGSDVIVNCTTSPDASAKEGKDFVFTNMHDLRINGDGNHSSANVYGVVLSVVQPTGAQPISVSDAESTAEFTIRK